MSAWTRGGMVALVGAALLAGCACPRAAGNASTGERASSDAPRAASASYGPCEFAPNCNARSALNDPRCYVLGGPAAARDEDR